MFKIMRFFLISLEASLQGISKSNVFLIRITYVARAQKNRRKVMKIL